MKFDYFEKYQELSNVDLLKIINRPTEYQSEAIVTANQILLDREVTDAEIIECESYYQRLDLESTQKKVRIETYKEKAVEFFEPVINPNTEIKPSKWLNIFLLVIGLQYLWSFYNTVKRLISFVQCKTCGFDISVLFEIASIIYVPIIFYLLIKRRRWGWILLFADNLFSAISQLCQSYIYFKYWDPTGNSVLTFILPILIKTAFAFFLWRNEISTSFGVTIDVKKKTALITTTLTLSFNGIMMMLYG